MTTTPNNNVNTTAPVANPTVVFVTKQVGYTVSSLAMVFATIVLALNHFIADGEIVTLLVTAVGAHVLASVNPSTTGSTTVTNNPAANTVAIPTPSAEPIVIPTQPTNPPVIGFSSAKE